MKINGKRWISWGAMGAAVATLCTFALLASLGMLVSRSAAGVEFELTRIAGGIAIVAAAGLATWPTATR